MQEKVVKNITFPNLQKVKSFQNLCREEEKQYLSKSVLQGFAQN